MEYICGYCGKSYPTIEERMKCEASCRETIETKKERMQTEKRQEEMNRDYKELDDMVDKRNKMNADIRELRESLDKKYYGAEADQFYSLLDIPCVNLPRDLIFRW